MRNYVLATVGALFLLAVSGCAVSEQDQRNGAPTISNYVDKAKHDITEELGKRVEDKLKDNNQIVDDKFKSQNAVQANVNALLGGSIGKLGEDVTGVKLGQADLVRAQADITNKMRDVNVELQNQIKINTELRVELNNQIQISNQMRVDLTNQIKISNDMEAKVRVSADAAVAAQAGFDNKISTMKNELTNDIKSGRDTIQNQLDANALKAVQSGNWVAIIIIVCLALVAVALFVCFVIVKIHSTARVNAEHNTKEMLRVVAKCMPSLTPALAQEVARDITHTPAKKDG